MSFLYLYGKRYSIGQEKEIAFFSFFASLSRISWHLLQVVCLIMGSLTLLVDEVTAQVLPPDRRYLFLEDRNADNKKKEKKAQIKARRTSLKNQTASMEGLPFDLDAGTINYDSSTNTVYARDNLLVGHQMGVIEAEEGAFNLDTNDVILKKNIKITEVATDITASEAKLNLNNGKLDVDDAKIYLEDGGYYLSAERISRTANEKYTLDNAYLTTCNCVKKGECVPWQLNGEKAIITRNGYGHLWNTTLEVKGVPVLYLPYFIFPAKTERQSGFLTPTVGYGRRSGYELQLPFFWAINYSSDATIIPVIESKIRSGVISEYRKVFSKRHKLELGLTYLNESERGDNLLGTDVSDLYDPTFDRERFAGYINHNAYFSVFGHQLQWVADGGYVSDDLLLREFENDKIGSSSSRYVTSQATLRSTFLDRYSVDLSSEYNQAIVSNDDFVFQRAPQILIQGLDVIRPFGDNPFGTKLVFNTQLSAINFLRDSSYQGRRYELYEKIKIPFHFQNIFDAKFVADVRASKYELSRTEIVDWHSLEVKGEFQKSTDRLVPGLTLQVDTVLEKVFQVGKDNWIKRIADLGVRGRTLEVTRLKHTIEPYIKYRYVPNVDQSKNPQFDSYDRLADRNVITYGVIQRLFSRHEPRNEYIYGLEEVSPLAEDMASLSNTGIIDKDFAFGVSGAGVFGYSPVRRGSVQELATFSLKQSLDIDALRTNSDIEDNEDDSREFSDVSAEISLRPNEYIGFHASTNYDVEALEVSSYVIEGQFSDKRGDELRTRFRFLDDNVSQLETSLQINLHRRVKLGYYSRYDELKGEFLDQRAGIRFLSDCNCWKFDLDVADRINPDETTFSFTITLEGLGSFGNSFFEIDQDDKIS